MKFDLRDRRGRGSGIVVAAAEQGRDEHDDECDRGGRAEPDPQRCPVLGRIVGGDGSVVGELGARRGGAGGDSAEGDDRFEHAALDELVGRVAVEVVGVGDMRVGQHRPRRRGRGRRRLGCLGGRGVVADVDEELVGCGVGDAGERGVVEAVGQGRSR